MENVTTVSPEDEEQFMMQQYERYETLIKEVMVGANCDRAKAKRIIKARSRKVLEQYNKSVAANANKPKLVI